MYRQAVILVKRDSPANRAKSLQLLKEAIQENISVVIAPEGTFNMTGRPLAGILRWGLPYRYRNTNSHQASHFPGYIRQDALQEYLSMTPDGRGPFTCLWYR